MSARDDEFDAQLAESGDDRPGIDDLEENDYSALGLGAYVVDPDADDDSDDDDDDSDDEDDDSDDEDDEDDEDEDDYPDDATEDEVDLVAAFYREDGAAAGLELPKGLANDFEELVDQLRRVPGDAGAVGVVSIDASVFVLARVRGRHLQVLLSDIIAANDWPIARDIADMLGLDIPEDDEEGGPVGDLDMFADVGLSEFELETLSSDLDAESLDVLEQVLGRLGFATAFEKIATAFDL